jgi:hypothetical protein
MGVSARGIGEGDACLLQTGSVAQSRVPHSKPAQRRATPFVHSVAGRIARVWGEGERSERIYHTPQHRRLLTSLALQYYMSCRKKTRGEERECAMSNIEKASARKYVSDEKERT